MANYAENMYNRLRKSSYHVKKYDTAGIYCIKIDDQIVYIGKSTNMLKRVSQHYAGIQTGSEKKYRLIKEIQRKGHRVGFDVMYYAKRRGQALQEEIGYQEGVFIRRYMPIFNTQIPKENDWTKYDYREVKPDEIRKYFDCECGS